MNKVSKAAIAKDYFTPMKNELFPTTTQLKSITNNSTELSSSPTVTTDELALEISDPDNVFIKVEELSCFSSDASSSDDPLDVWFSTEVDNAVGGKQSKRGKKGAAVCAEDVFTCTICNQQYSSKKGLLQHKNTTHEVSRTRKKIKGAQQTKRGKRAVAAKSHANKIAHLSNGVDRQTKTIKKTATSSVNHQIVSLPRGEENDPLDEWFSTVGSNNCDATEGVNGIVSLSSAQCDDLGNQIGNATTTSDEDRVFDCELCGKSFPTAKQLTLHLPMKHPDSELRNLGKPFKCDLCPKAYTRRDNLVAHQRTHSGKGCFQCPICDKRFGYVFNLNRHLRFHNKLKIFKCDICGKSFTRKDTLTEHSKIHTSDYKC